MSYLADYIRSSLSRSAYEQEKGLKRTTITRWLRTFALEDKPSPVMSKQLSKSEQELHDEIYRLRQENCSLKAELKRSTMERDVYNCMIDLAEKTYNIPVRKNSDAK